MKIRSVEAQIIAIPFNDGGKPKPTTPTTWNKLEMVLVRIEDTDGNVGWGEAFGYFVTPATKAIIDNLLKPLLEGSEITSIRDWSHSIQHRLHIFGRYGITLFAISGVDIALWDLWAKRQNAPLYSLLGDGKRKSLKTYASLVGYNDRDTAVSQCLRAVDDGFSIIKIHEPDIKIITACHEAIAKASREVKLAIDVNGCWQAEQTYHNIEHLLGLPQVAWLEEPVFPPEDFAQLAQFRQRGIALGAGENWCTRQQFLHAVEQHAVDYLQPSVTKVGGISEFLQVVEIAGKNGLPVLPHSPYFGPGFLTTLHLANAYHNISEVEFLYVEPQAELFAYDTIRQGNVFSISDRPGIGMDPDPAVISRYTLS
ncbi:mandelate racemase/muconate lactonizing enzyme family protein [Pantoea sp. CCBC3-3-1]|uniref:mandelate racemase/muconate lactonizing enzyme family protein n=1 Tax=Pantoea sp. CCBC3-3-1 TaxID=2490851 RepID=UPI0011BED766|nr:mandelate racemase/muconate lactonizing enzyme family protein [Pantoea sp. CCBC3-3-1]